MRDDLLRFYEELGIQQEPRPGISPESNGIAERHNLTLLDIARPCWLTLGMSGLGWLCWGNDLQKLFWCGLCWLAL
jgi:hypothetical protein